MWNELKARPEPGGTSTTLPPTKTLPLPFCPQLPRRRYYLVCDNEGEADRWIAQLLRFTVLQHKTGPPEYDTADSQALDE